MKAKPITARQSAFLARLIAAAGKRQYQEAKRRIGLHGLTIMQLSARQASDLIQELQRGRQ